MYIGKVSISRGGRPGFRVSPESTNWCPCRRKEDGVSPEGLRGNAALPAL